MNRERLQMVRDRIAIADPSHFNMADWKCGSAMCIGGWANEIEGVESYDIDGAFRFMGLSQKQGWRLCFPDEGGVCLLNLTRDDALAALDSLINADSDDVLPVWPEPRT